MPEFEVVVHFHTTASSSITVTVEAENEEEAQQLGRDKADEEFEGPQICAQCSGWHQKWYLEVGDDWESQEVDRLDVKLVENE